MRAEDVNGWLERYVAAWQSYDRAEIGELFSEDARYRYHPYDDPVVGRDAIVESWLEEDRLDEPGSFEARYECYAVDGERAVATGASTYFEDGSVARVYDNVYLLRFDEDGRCSEFTEWFMQRP
jgi:ketosteroid isomerase-like protein